MCFAKIGLMVALYQAYLENVGQRFIVGIQGVCVQFPSNRTSGDGDYAFTDGLTHGHTHTHTDEGQNIQ